MKFTHIFILILALNKAIAFDLRAIRAPETSAKELILGQQGVTADSFSYLVCLSIQQNLLKRSLCSGSLIGNEWILTAAHCTMNAITGSVYLGPSNGITGEIVYTVTKNDITIHPSWDYNTGNNDISLIKIPYSVGFQPVKLPSASSFYSNYNGDRVLAMGWQHESNTFSSTESKLKWAALQVAPKKTCSMPDVASTIYNTICAVAEQRVSACNTDAGGPLVLESSNVQIGLNTLRDPTGCSDTNTALFTRVYDYLDWIESHTGITY